MAKYFFDTEFIEGEQAKRFLGIKIGKTKPTIDLISIGMVSEEGREFYAISKEFNLKDAWNRYQIKSYSGRGGIGEKTHEKEYWIRENVLLPIYKEYVHGGMRNHIPFSYKTMKWILKGFGKANAQIAEEIKEFVYNQPSDDKYNGTFKTKPEFYAYYADYDWVLFCWLFGKMIDLPESFPMYCIDLKQTLDEKANFELPNQPINERVSILSQSSKYPKQTNEHNALSDARWNRSLWGFLKNI